MTTPNPQDVGGQWPAFPPLPKHYTTLKVNGAPLFDAFQLHQYSMAYGELCRAESEEWVRKWRALSDSLTALVKLNLAQSEREARLGELCRAAPAGGDAVRDALAGQTIYLMGREHINEERKPLAELVYGMTVPGTGVLFCMKDTEAEIPKVSAPAVSATREGDVDPGLIEALSYQSQCDEDGTMCIVSRQAVDEAIALLRTLSRVAVQEGK